MNKKIVASACYWKCENMDLLAPICEEGTQILFDDGSTLLIADNSIEKVDTSDFEWATEEEKKDYLRKNRDIIFKGDKVIIKRGRKMVGEVKEVLKSYRFYVEGTYQKVYTDYLVFTDHTKVNINHCDVVGVQYNDDKYPFRFYENGLYNCNFGIGGRL